MAIARNYYKELPDAFVATANISGFAFNSNSGVDRYYSIPELEGDTFTVWHPIYFHTSKADSAYPEDNAPYGFATNPDDRLDIYQERLEPVLKVVESPNIDEDKVSPSLVQAVAAIINRTTSQFAFLDIDGNMTTAYTTSNAPSAVELMENGKSGIVPAQIPGNVLEFNYEIPEGWTLVGFDVRVSMSRDVLGPTATRAILAGFWLYGTSAYEYDIEKDKPYKLSIFDVDNPFG